MKFNFRKTLILLAVIFSIFLVVNTVSASDNTGISDIDHINSNISSTDLPYNDTYQTDNDASNLNNTYTENDVPNYSLNNSSDKNILKSDGSNVLRCSPGTLNVTKITLNETVKLGEQVTFTIIVKNVGWEPVYNSPITIDDWADEGLVFVHYDSIEPYASNLQFKGLQKTWLGDFYRWEYPIAQWWPFYPGYEIRFNVTYNTTKPGKLYNHVNLWAPGYPEQVKSENSTFVKDPKFTVEKILVNNDTRIGDTIVYNIVINNTGNVELGNITVKEEFPDALEYLGVNGNWTYDGNDLFKLNSPLAVNGTTKLNIRFKVIHAGNITNIVIVSSNETDNKTANNTTFVKDPKLNIEKITITKKVNSGEDVIFKIIIKNIGNVDLNNITVTESYPKELILKSYSGEGWTRNNNLFNYGNTLNVNDTIILELVFKTTVAGNFTNIVYVSSDLTNRTNATNVTEVVSIKNDTNNTNNTNNTKPNNKSNNKALNLSKEDIANNKTGNPIFILLIVIGGLVLASYYRKK